MQDQINRFVERDWRPAAFCQVADVAIDSHQLMQPQNVRLSAAATQLDALRHYTGAVANSKH